MKYRLKSVKDTDKFCEELKKCPGKVTLETEDGDTFNLHSRLAQLLSVNLILTGATQLEGVTLDIEKNEDAEILLKCVDIQQ